MKIKISFVAACLLYAIATLVSCSDENKVNIDIAQAYRNLEFDAFQGRQTIRVESSGVWQLSSSEEWCTTSHEIGEGSQYVNISVTRNTQRGDRDALLTLSAKGNQEVIINVKQRMNKLPVYPEAIEPDQTGMRELTALQMVPLMGAGMNIGNTFDAIFYNKDTGLHEGDETIWGNRVPGKPLFEAIQAAGFKCVRIPLSFSHQLEDQTNGEYKIRDAWFEKIEQAVNNALESGLFVMINIHHEGQWMGVLTDAAAVEMNPRFETYWKQIALRFRDYDDRLLFAAMNEVQHDGLPYGQIPSEENFRIHNNLNQLFVNTVRATGGRNYYRHLIAPAYVTNIEHAHRAFVPPVDVMDQRLFLECHYYDPFPYTIMERDDPNGPPQTVWGRPFLTDEQYAAWGGQEDHMEQQIGLLKKFTDQGIPTIIGEYMPGYRPYLEWEEFEKHWQSRCYYHEYMAKTCRANNAVPVAWECGYEGDLTNRVTEEIRYPDLVEAIMRGMK